MRLRRWGLGLAAALLLAPAAVAQAPAKLDDPEANIVEELVVRPTEGGPAWWRVSDDDTTVYILALPDGRIPPDLKWDTRGLERRLHNSNALVGGAQPFRARLRDIPLLFSLRRSLRQKGAMEDDLPEDLRARFVAARERIGKPADRYAHWGPLMAGMLLTLDGRDGPRWKDAEPAVRKVARRQKVAQPHPPAADAAPLLKEFRDGLTPEIQQRCLEAALDDAADGEARAVKAAEGWAVGDIATALTAPRGFEKCFLLLGGGLDAWNLAVKNQADEIAAALEKPGKAVAMVRLRRLLAKGGVIEQLEARGLKVEAPTSAPAR